MIQRVDLFILKQFQQISDKIHECIGLNNFKLARYLLILYSILIIFRFDHIMEIRGSVNGVLKYTFLITYLVGFILGGRLTYEEHFCEINQERTNTLTKCFSSFRIVLLLSVVCLALAWAVYAAGRFSGAFFARIPFLSTILPFLVSYFSSVNILSSPKGHLGQESDLR